jgi:hypothetical protein
VARCYDKYHEFCYTDCEGPTCYAYYEEESQQCFTSCETTELEGLIKYSLQRYKLEGVTSLHAKGLKHETLLRISNIYVRVGLTFRSQPEAPSIVEGARNLFSQLNNLQSFFVLKEVRWNRATPYHAVRALLHAVRPSSAL